ncbi:unnamed protein product [Closterium sp. Naga37s-1]|nr:unnamed protein product [Closterium sp. Naga37s-1]
MHHLHLHPHTSSTPSHVIRLLTPHVPSLPCALSHPMCPLTPHVPSHTPSALSHPMCPLTPHVPSHSPCALSHPMCPLTPHMLSTPFSPATRFFPSAPRLQPLDNRPLSSAAPSDVAASSTCMVHAWRLHYNSLSGTIPASIAHLTALTNLCAHSPSTPLAHSPSTCLSPILPSPTSLPLSLNHSLSHSPSTTHSPILPPPLTLPFSLHPHLSPFSLHHSLSYSPFTRLSPKHDCSDTQQEQSFRLHSRGNYQPHAVTGVVRGDGELHLKDLHSNKLSGTIPAAIGNLTGLNALCAHSPSTPPMSMPSLYLPLCAKHCGHLDNNQLAGELPSFHHMARLTSLEAHHNYLTATADQLLPNAHSLDDPFRYHSLCLFHHNCLGDNSKFCNREQAQRRASECRAFCGTQPLTPPCSGHGVCSYFVPHPPHNKFSCCGDEDQIPPPNYQPKGQCDSDEGYTPGTDAGTCVPHGMPCLLMSAFAR